jgi:succinate-semialdehyde dehydrogenase/glutarate-semialdehyde dehydrogenase
MHISLFIDGGWQNGADGRTLPVINPATGRTIGDVAVAETADLDAAAAAAGRAFRTWREVSVHDRGTILRRAASLLRERADEIAAAMTAEQGKPLAEARGETIAAGGTLEWYAEEARRDYGRIVPARAKGVTQTVRREPIGPVVAFTPWNFPINQAVRKIAAALATGCTLVLKGPEETPASCAALVQAMVDAGVPPGVLNLVFGVPADISSHLIAHPIIRKVSFTGSTAVGKHLAALAGAHMKPVTMELGGHAPVLVFDDADVNKAADIMGAAKLRNAGQVCISPTRFLVQEKVYGAFRDRVVDIVSRAQVGDGMDPGTQMGPLANARRRDGIEQMIADAVGRGARLATGGTRIGNEGFFLAPAVLEEVPLDAAAMTSEPFGPLALLAPFARYEDAVEEANRLPYGLAAYAFSRSASTVAALGRDIECGMLSINHHGIGLPELPFGGVKDSGYGSEGGSEGLQPYLTTKMVTVLTE